MDKCLPLAEVSRLDATLSALGRGQAALRLRIGELGNALSVGEGFAELGFSRVADYSIERCGKKSGWLGELRGLARRLGKLPAMREAMCGGELSWSMALVCARETTPEREAEVLAQAKTSTVRKMQKYFGDVAPESSMPPMQTEPSRHESWEELEQLEMCDEEASYARRRKGPELTTEPHEGEACAAPDGRGFPSHGAGASLFDAAAGERTEVDEDDACIYDRITRHTVQRTVPEAVVFKFEATRILLDHLDGGTMSQDQIMESMLTEAQTKLDLHVDFGTMRNELECADETRRDWLKTKRAIDEAAWEACEPRIPAPEPADVLLDAGPIPETPEKIDSEIVGLCEVLAMRDLQMGRLALKIVAADGWRRMGFAGLGQYARERVGVSKRTLEQKMKLARQVDRFPAVGEALERREINVEAALRICGIASEATVDAWIERAGRRTVKHLEEEIEAVRRLERLGAPKDMGPPSDEALNTAFGIERMVVSGELVKGESGRSEASERNDHDHLGSGAAQMSGARGDGDALVGCDSGGAQMSALAGGLAEGVGVAQMSGVLRFRMSKENYIRFMALEQAYEREAKVPGKCFLEFMLEAVWETWGERFRRTVAYHEIYERDRNRCTNPVCRGRTALNPHHLEFRSRGGTDEPENVVSACFDCHIPGIHMGRITAEPPASNMRWVIGRKATLVVHGREKISSRPGAEIWLVQRGGRDERHAA